MIECRLPVHVTNKSVINILSFTAMPRSVMPLAIFPLQSCDRHGRYVRYVSCYCSNWHRSMSVATANHTNYSTTSHETCTLQYTSICVSVYRYAAHV